MSSFSNTQPASNSPFYLGPTGVRRAAPRSHDNTIELGELNTRHNTHSAADMTQLESLHSQMFGPPAQLSPSATRTRTRTSTGNTLVEPHRASPESSKRHTQEQRELPPVYETPATLQAAPSPQATPQYVRPVPTRHWSEEAIYSLSDQEAGRVAAMAARSGAEAGSPKSSRRRKCCWAAVGLVAVAAIAAGVGAGVGISRANAEADEDSSYSPYSPSDSTSTPNSIGVIGYSSTRPGTSPYATSTISRSQAASTTSTSPVSTPTANLAWTPGRYNVAFTKNYDNCSRLDLSCQSSMQDTWYVSASGSNYNIIGNQNSTTFTAPISSSQLTFGPDDDSVSNSDGCLFGRTRTYTLTPQGSRASGTLAIHIAYNLDISCVETSGTFLNQGASCDCRWDLSAS